MANKILSKDVLQLVPYEKLFKLQHVYKNVGAATAHIYNFLSSVIKWKTSQPEGRYFSVLELKDVGQNGTFIGINKCHFFGMVLSTLEDSGRELHTAISKTKLIDWKQPWMLCSVDSKLFPIVMDALKKTPFEFAYSECYSLYRLPPEIAKQLNIKYPTDAYVDHLIPEHAKTINKYWAHRYIGSEQYFATYIKINGGYGVFLKTDNQLVSWALYDSMCLSGGYTLAAFRRKGYSKFSIEYLSKKLAESGRDPMAEVYVGNTASENMITGVGFQKIGNVCYIVNRQMQEIMENSQENKYS